MKCKCGNDNFYVEWGNLNCSACGARKYITYSSEEYKVTKPNSKQFFWVVMTPKFMERMEKYFPNMSNEQILKDCSSIEKFYNGTWPKVRVPTQGAKWNDHHIYWKFKFNPQKKRKEIILFNITTQDIFQSKRKEQVEFVTVNFK